MTMTRAALAAQRLRAALADFAEAEDHRDLAAEHDVGGAVEPVDDRVAAAVDVVELALRHRVVDVDRREEQRAGFHHLVEAVHAGRRLFADAPEGRGDVRPALRALGEALLQEVEDDAPLFGIALGLERRHLPGLLELDALVHEQRRIAAVVDDERRAGAVGPHQRLARAPPVLLERLALPREDRHALGILDRATGFGTADDDRGGGVILRREDVARDPAHIGAELGQRLDEDRRLNRHVQAAHDPRAGQRLLALVALAERHQARHFLLGQADFLAAELGLRQVLDLEWFAARFHGGVEGVHLFHCGSHSLLLDCFSSRSASSFRLRLRSASSSNFNFRSLQLQIHTQRLVAPATNNAGPLARRLSAATRS